MEIGEHIMQFTLSSTCPSCCLVTSCVRLFCDPHGLQHGRLLCPWDSPGKRTRIGCHFLLQEIFPTQGLNPCLLHLQADSLPLSHLGSSTCPRDKHSSFRSSPSPKQFSLYFTCCFLTLHYTSVCFFTSH